VNQTMRLPISTALIFQPAISSELILPRGTTLLPREVGTLCKLPQQEPFSSRFPSQRKRERARRDFKLNETWRVSLSLLDIGAIVTARFAARIALSISLIIVGRIALLIYPINFYLVFLSSSSCNVLGPPRYQL